MSESATDYRIVIEKSPNNYAAYVPDLPGCVAVGASRREVTRNMREAIKFHLDGMREDGDPIPEPSGKAPVEADAGRGRAEERGLHAHGDPS